MGKFQGKYRISSARLRNWDYASKGMYFITLCTNKREHYFGQIIQPEINKEHFAIQLSDIGKMVESEWLKTPDVRPDMNLTLDEYQVMPNHFHAILIIGNNKFNSNGLDYETNKNPIAIRRDAMLASLTLTDSESKSDNESTNEPNSDSDNHTIFELETQMIKNTNSQGKNKFTPQSKNLGSVMRGFKSKVTSYTNDHQIVFGWQPRYYDHIIRNYNEYERIANYIQNNPDNWGNDRLR